MRTNRLRYIFIATLIVLFIGSLVFLNYRLSLREFSVKYQNINKVYVYSTKSVDSGKNPKPIKTITYSGQSVKIPKGAYTIYYEGKNGYNSLYKYFYLYKNGQVLWLSPGYSQSKLDSIRDAQLPAIKKAIADKYPLVSLYEIKPGSLYGNGEWYGTTLVYKGGDVFNSDTLRIVLHKEGGTWAVKTSPPNISLSKLYNPGIPEDILNSVNTQ